MQLQIKYFGLLAEVTQCSEESVQFEQTTIHELVSQLIQQHPGLKTKEFKVAENFELVLEDQQVTGPEIALLPPFSGG